MADDGFRHYGDIVDDSLPSAIAHTVEKLTQRQLVSGEFLRDNISVSTYQDATAFISGNMVFELNTFIRTHRLPPRSVCQNEKLECAEPASWWQHWKHDVAASTPGLRWINRRWPTRMAIKQHTLSVIVNLERFWFYPDAPHDPRLGRAFKGHNVSTSAEWKGQQQ